MSEIDYFTGRLESCADDVELKRVALDIGSSDLSKEDKQLLRVVFRECQVACIVFDESMRPHDKAKKLELLRGKASDGKREGDVPADGG